MLRTNKESKELHTVLGLLKIDEEEKRGMIQAVTLGRTRSSRELTSEECQALTKSLRQKAGKPRFPTDDPANLMRRKILAICHEMQWTIDDKVDWKRLDKWLKKYGMHHKGLNKLTLQELPSQVTQFEQLLRTYYDQKQVPAKDVK